MYLFKYMSLGTAQAALETRSLRWSSPRRFNDPFDVQFNPYLQYDPTTALARAIAQLWRIYSGETAIEPRNTLGARLVDFKASHPNLTREEFFQRGLGEAMMQSIVRMEALLPSLQAWLRSRVSPLKVLCLSELGDNILMWSHYGHNHGGAVLRFSADNRQLVVNGARPVRYSHAMPLLMDEGDVVAFFSGQKSLIQDRIIDDLVFVKAIDWSYEREWRAILSDRSDTDFIDIPFDTDEATALYLGCAMGKVERADLVARAKQSLPGIAVYAARKADREFALIFDQIA